MPELLKHSVIPHYPPVGGVGVSEAGRTPTNGFDHFYHYAEGIGLKRLRGKNGDGEDPFNPSF